MEYGGLGEAETQFIELAGMGGHGRPWAGTGWDWLGRTGLCCDGQGCRAAMDRATIDGFGRTAIVGMGVGMGGCNGLGRDGCGG